MKTVEKQKEVALTILEQLRVVDPHCILAGGAPRDWYFTNPANDLDFYFTSTSSTIDSNRKQLERALGQELSLLMDKPDRGRLGEEYQSMESLRRIWEFERGGVPVQLMQLFSPGDQFKIVDQMDVSICKAWWLGEEIHLHTDFQLTLASNVMFLKGGYSWDKKHAVKMAERFPKMIRGRKETAEQVIIRNALKEKVYEN